MAETTAEKKTAPDPKNGAAAAGEDASANSQGAPAVDTNREDIAPKKRGRPKGSKTKNKKGPGRPRSTPEPGDERKAETRRLAKKLDGFLKGPGFAFEAMGEDWPAKHVDAAGKNLASALADAAEKNPQLKLRLEALMEGGQTAQLVIATIMYIAPLGIYFGMIPAPPRVRGMMGIPYREASGVAQEVPPEVIENATAEAKAAGFVDAFGNGDLDAYMRAQQEAMQGVRGDQ